MRAYRLLPRRECRRAPPPFILEALTGRPLHGYVMAARPRHMADDALRVGAGSLYPALHRLPLRGWVTADCGVSEETAARSPTR
ncbi:helix-turn-helix transcriptional regulator [Corallococcus macrosporus]|uniref:PadR family transcriptional regulator n=1 Tax=Myxococcus fulvus (strain ATCC BAA-855 / HW-1) TaxID=483219 RepID=F8CJ56_MYXFH|nr:PadR family transcriptional regulator [Corallococcus macrosporus]